MKFFRLKTGACIRVLAVAMGVFLACLPVFSQGSAGRILGSVTDQSGGVLAGATVTVLDVALEFCGFIGEKVVNQTL